MTEVELSSRRTRAGGSPIFTMLHWQMARRKSWLDEDMSSEDLPQMLGPDSEDRDDFSVNLAQDRMPGISERGRNNVHTNVGYVGSDGSVKSHRNKPDERPVPGLVVRPGWNILDYHLYLLSNEKGRDEHTRKNSMYIFDGEECTIRSYKELFDDEVLAPFNVGDDPQIVFNILPIIDQDASKCHAGYILGFNFVDKTMYARYFDWIPHIEDLGFVWNDGWNMYEVHIYDLLDILEDCFDLKKFFPGEGILSKGHCCRSKKSDDPGMELVMTILFCQWIVDAADPLFAPAYLRIGNLKELTTGYERQCRLVLQRASARAWHCIRDGWIPEDLARSLTLNAWTNDLYTYVDSMYAENEIPWPAPGLTTSAELREQYIETRKAETSAEVRFERLFNKAEDDDKPNPEDEVLKQMLEMSGPDQADQLLGHESLDLVTPIETFDETSSQIDRFLSVSLEWLARRLAYLMLDRPELDNLSNRESFGEVLLRMGISMQQQPDEHLNQLPGFPMRGDFWRLVADSPEADTSSTSELPPSPTIVQQDE